MVQGTSCIITILEVECSIDCSNSLSRDYTGLVLENPEKGLWDCACIGPAICEANFSLGDHLAELHWNGASWTVMMMTTLKNVTYLKPFSLTMYWTRPSTSGSDHLIFYNIMQKQYFCVNQGKYKIIYFYNSLLHWIHINYTVSQKNWATFIFTITLANVDWFQ